MRKIFSFAISTLLLASCESDNTIQPLIHPDNEVIPIRDVLFHVQGFQWEKNTRTHAVATETDVELYWAAGDTIGVFPTSSGSQIEFVVEESKPATTASCDGGAWLFREGNTYVAFYPYNYQNHSCREIMLDYTGQTSTGSNDLSSIGTYDYIYATATAPIDNVIDFEMKHLGALLELSVTMPENVEISAANVALSIVGENIKFPTKLALDLSGDASILVTTESQDNFLISVKDITPATNNILLYVMLPELGSDPVTLQATLFDAEEVEYVGNNNLTFNQGIIGGKSYQQQISMAPKTH